MATVHVGEIQRWLSERGQPDAEPGSGGMFFEIRFGEDGSEASGVVDPEFAGRVLTVDSPQGVVTITFDDAGMLKALDIS